MKNKLAMKVTVAFASLLVMNGVHADDNAFDLRMDRYTLRSTAVTDTQLMPLNQIINIRFSGGAVRDAITKTLRVTGYRLYIPTSPLLLAMLDKPLAVNQQRFEHIRITGILHALAGPAFTVLVDPANRLVSFELRPAYRTNTAPHDAEARLD